MPSTLDVWQPGRSQTPPHATYSDVWRSGDGSRRGRRSRETAQARFGGKPAAEGEDGEGDPEALDELVDDHEERHQDEDGHVPVPNVLLGDERVQDCEQGEPPAEREWPQGVPTGMPTGMPRE